MHTHTQQTTQQINIHFARATAVYRHRNPGSILSNQWSTVYSKHKHIV